MSQFFNKYILPPDEKHTSWELNSLCGAFLFICFIVFMVLLLVSSFSPKTKNVQSSKIYAEVKDGRH